MMLYGLELPDLVPENATAILETCRNIHQATTDRQHRNTQRRRWDQYWIDAYNIVIKKLNS